jgi:hypothetical protein
VSASAETHNSAISRSRRIRVLNHPAAVIVMTPPRSL